MTPFVVRCRPPAGPLARWGGRGWLVGRPPPWWEIRWGGLRRQFWRALSSAPAELAGGGLWLCASARGWSLCVVPAGDLPPWADRLPAAPPPARARALLRALEEALPAVEAHLA